MFEDADEKISVDDLKPGMQADVFVVTGERTILEYMVSPLLDRLRDAFRER